MLVLDCLIVLFSKLKTEILLMTMELEIFALAHCGRELFLVMDIVKEVCKVVTN
jgi:hypothetical protein